MKPLDPIVVILGATGTGKSKLSIEIAKKFNGEVISADSMQVYEGLDIVTNKVTITEQDGIPHHMLNFLHPLNSYTVIEFRDQVLPIIKTIHAENKLPVIVGGTHYYIEALLWKLLIQTNDSSGKYELSNPCKHKLKVALDNLNPKRCKIEEDFHHSERDIFSCPVTTSELHTCVKCEGKVGERMNIDINTLTDDDLMKRLHEVDPISASKYHPNEKRKVKRALEIYLSTGIPQSVHYERQKESVGGKSLGGELRFSNVALIWIECEKNVLLERLNSRVHDMIQAGLLDELTQFHHEYNSSRLNNATPETSLYTNGIFQSIGFKEFHNYLIMNKEQQDSDVGQAAYKQGIEDMKVHTRQYSKRQIKWIRNRLLVRERNRLPIYTVDGTDPSQWESRVFEPAEKIVHSLLRGEKCSIEPVHIKEDNDFIIKGDKTRHFCEICDKVLIGGLQWNEHIGGNRHKKMVKAKKVLKNADEASTKTEEIC